MVVEYRVELFPKGSDLQSPYQNRWLSSTEFVLFYSPVGELLVPANNCAINYHAWVGWPHSIFVCKSIKIHIFLQLSIRHVEHIKQVFCFLAVRTIFFSINCYLHFSLVLERTTRFELVSTGWKPGAQPIYQIR